MAKPSKLYEAYIREAKHRRSFDELPSMVAMKEALDELAAKWGTNEIVRYEHYHTLREVSGAAFMCYVAFRNGDMDELEIRLEEMLMMHGINLIGDFDYE